MTIRFYPLALLALLAGCGITSTSGSDGGNEPCVCIDNPSPGECKSVIATSDCLGGKCCVFADDAAPPYFDDAGTCPGMCASPDDIGCGGSWYRATNCSLGTLCCASGAGHDAGADAAADQ